MTFALRGMDASRAVPEGHGQGVVALIVDAGALYAQADADADAPRHAYVRAILEREREAIVTSELAVAEAEGLPDPRSARARC